MTDQHDQQATPQQLVDALRTTQEIVQTYDGGTGRSLLADVTALGWIDQHADELDGDPDAVMARLIARGVRWGFRDDDDAQHELDRVTEELRGIGVLR